MALHLTCDMCGKGLLLDEDVRYEVKIEVKAAYDPLEITPQDLNKNLEEEMRNLLVSMEKMDPSELQDQVYKIFNFDLCAQCQKLYLKNPLPPKEL